MINTVVLSGKGWNAAMLFHVLVLEFPGNTYTERKLRWWQSTTRYELRLQNLSFEEIDFLVKNVNMYYPVASYIKVEVF